MSMTKEQAILKAKSEFDDQMVIAIRKAAAEGQRLDKQRLYAEFCQQCEI